MLRIVEMLSGGRIVALLAALFVAHGVALGGQAPYPGDFGQAVATVVIFGVLLVILGKYAWKPIVAHIRRREEDIATRISDTEQRNAKAEKLIREYREQLDHIDAKGETMLAEARKKASAEKGNILNIARQEAHQAIGRAREDIETARQEAREDLQAETAGMAATIAEKFLRRNLSDEDHRRLLEEATRQIAQKAGQQK